MVSDLMGELFCKTSSLLDKFVKKSSHVCGLHVMLGHYQSILTLYYKFVVQRLPVALEYFISASKLLFHDTIKRTLNTHLILLVVLSLIWPLQYICCCHYWLFRGIYNYLFVNSLPFCSRWSSKILICECWQVKIKLWHFFSSLNIVWSIIWKRLL